MHLIRHLTPDGPAYAALLPDGTARAVEGEIGESLFVTERFVVPGKRLAPVEPPAIFCIGLNYRQHALEGGRTDIPTQPVVFMKPPSAVQHPGAPIELPACGAQEVDYECELAVVIGSACKNATRENALDHVLGYTCANDVSARDWQRKPLGGGQWCQAKGFDTFCPLGPVIVTADELTQPNALRIQTRLNGQTLQDWNTNDMIFDVPTLIAFLSAGRTLAPGTVILTGTPHGVGFARTPPVFMKPGDTVEIDIEGIGILANPVVAG